MRVTLRTKSSHSDAIDIGASCRLPSASPASRRLSTNPIIVEAPEDLMTEVKALIAAADGPAAGSSLRKAAYASEASTRLEPGMDTRRLRALCGTRTAPRPAARATSYHLRKQLVEEAGGITVYHATATVNILYACRTSTPNRSRWQPLNIAC